MSGAMAGAAEAKKRARIIAVGNQKGGVGKTTTSVTLAAAFVRLGLQVLLVDLDPHACASVHLRYYPDAQDATINDIFTSEEQNWPDVWAKVRYRYEGLPLDVAPGSIRLAELETDLKGRQGKGAVLQRAFAVIRGEYDIIVLDCPPHVGILLVNALVACDLLVVPIQTDFLALHGLKLLFDTVKILNKVLPQPVNYRTLATMFDRRAKACHRVLTLLEQKMGDKMFQTIVGMDTRFRDASAAGRVIYEIDAETRGAQEYEDLAREILRI